MDKWIFYGFMLASVVISAFSQILLKKSAKREHKSAIYEYLNPYVICGYGLLVVSTITTILAYKGIDYKEGPVIESLGFILVMILSFFFFGEKITKKKALGYLLILAGVFVFYL